MCIRYSIGPVAMSIAVYPGREVHITVADKGIGILDIPQDVYKRQLIDSSR